MGSEEVTGGIWQRLRPRYIGWLVVGCVAGFIFASCSDGRDDEVVVTEDGGRVSIVAKESRWLPDSVIVLDDVEFVVVIDNQDVGISHNLVVEGLPSGSAGTELAVGPVRQELALKISEKSSYPFVCTIHPAMRGTLEVR